jgi:hypothetical protein
MLKQHREHLDAVPRAVEKEVLALVAESDAGRGVAGVFEVWAECEAAQVTKLGPLLRSSSAWLNAVELRHGDLASSMNEQFNEALRKLQKVSV